MSALPLLPAQQAKWEAWCADPASGAHTIGTLLRVRGPLDPARLQHALDAVQAAQPALRATFRDGRQFVHPPQGVELRQAQAEDADSARTLAAALTAEPFDLSAGPVLRALLVRIANDDHVLALALPSVVVDGWSMNVLLTDLERVCRAPAAVLPDQADAYGRICARRSAGDARAAYQEWIAGVPRLALPTDLARPQVRSFAGAEVRVDLGAGAAEEIAAAARRLRTSPFPLLFTAFATVLGRRSGQNRFLVGAFVAGRPLPEEHPVIGRFANLLPLPVDLTGPDPVRTTSRMWWASHDFHDVVADARAVDVEFVLNVGEPDLSPTGELRITREREPSTVALRDLTFFAGPTATGFELRVEYRTDLYRADTAWAVLHEYRDVLAELTTQRDNPVTATLGAEHRNRSTA